MMGNFIKNNAFTVGRVLAQVMLFFLSLQAGWAIHKIDQPFKTPLLSGVAVFYLWDAWALDKILLNKYGAKSGKRNHR